MAVVQENRIEIDSIRNPYLMECVQGKLIFANMNQSKMISLFDATSGKFIGDFLDRGEGPEESLFISNLVECDNQLAVFDSEKQRMCVYSVDAEKPQKISEIVFQTDSALLFSMFNCIPLDGGYIAATGLVKGNRIALLDYTGKAITGFGCYPGAKKDSDVENGFAYQGFMAYNPTKKTLAMGSGFGESISFYRMENTMSPVLLEEYVYALPAYKDASNEYSQGVAFKKENIMGFIAMKPSPDYCIGLYSGDVRNGVEYGGDKILLFDWNGKAVKALQLDQLYQQIAYNSQNREIVLFGVDKESGEYRVVTLPFSSFSTEVR